MRQALARTFTAATTAICMMTGGAALAQETAAKSATQIGAISVDVMGNEVKISALNDPKVEGVTCHFTNFSRGTASRLIGLVGGRNPFEDPSNTSIACRQTGAIKIGAIQEGEDIFSERASLIFKNIAVKRFFDCENNTLVYVSHSRQVIEGSAKASISTVPLFVANAEWKSGAKPVCGKK